jgi:hypothetical protein
MDRGMLFVVDSHDFRLGFGDLGFFVDSVELFLGVLVFVGQEGDVIGEIQSSSCLVKVHWIPVLLPLVDCSMT